jgi:hypothetical protein
MVDLLVGCRDATSTAKVGNMFLEQAKYDQETQERVEDVEVSLGVA